ncbi:MAG: VCBS repeat-containing protein [Verrucomicrobiota bacterium]
MSTIGFNSLQHDDTSAGSVGLLSRETFFYYGTSSLPGKHVLYLNFFDVFDATYTLSQRGDIPAGAGRYQFEEIDLSPSPAARLSLNGVPIDPVTRDLSAFAGKTDVEMDITVSYPLGHNWFIDSIQFIGPEPPFIENDFNGDGAQDVVFEHPGGFMGVWFMNNGPDLISASFFNPAAVADPRYHIVGTGDFNGDRQTDLLFQRDDGAGLSVWFINGIDQWSSAGLNPSQPGGGWKVVATGDVNHDGKKDIVFQHTDGTLAVWFMYGLSLVQGVLLSPSNPGDPRWRVVGTADLTGMGSTDLILQHTDGTLAAWYMDGTNLVRAALLNPSAPAEPGWRVAGTLDLNRDGKTDLLFQHDDGTVAVWLMDGINLISGQFLNPPNPGPGWRIVGPK